MSDDMRTPELKTVLGAMIFGANRSLTVKEMHRCLQEAGQGGDPAVAAYSGARESDVDVALQALSTDIDSAHCGFALRHVAGGYRLQSDAACGPWLRQLLDIGKPSRLSLPALETLAIIAYRQPITRGDIESIRGVSVDHVVKTLMEMQLVRIVGRSDLPGRPFMYGSTSTFLEHFGLSALDELQNIAPMLAAARRNAKVERDEWPAESPQGAEAEAEGIAEDEAPQVEAPAQEGSVENEPQQDEVSDPAESAQGEAPPVRKSLEQEAAEGGVDTFVDVG